jgi:hypothetical protein
MHDVQSMDRSYKQAGVMSVQRKSFVFSADVSERLERLASATRLESNSSVVRLALVVLEDLVEAIARGEKITIEDEAGQARAYNPFVAPSRTARNSRDAA